MKKKLFAVCLMMMSAVFVYGQMDQGGKYVGGNFNLGFGSTKYKSGSTSTDGPKTFNFGITPVGGYFIADNLMVGSLIGYNMNSVTEKGDGITLPEEIKTTTSSFNIGPFVRYYMMPTKTVGLFAQGSLGLGFGKIKEETTRNGATTTSDGNTSSFTFAVTPGIVWAISDMVELETSFGGLTYISATIKHGSGESEFKSTSSDFGLEFNPAFFTFGVGIHLQ